MLLAHLPPLGLRMAGILQCGARRFGSTAKVHVRVGPEGFQAIPDSPSLALLSVIVGRR